MSHPPGPPPAGGDAPPPAPAPLWGQAAAPGSAPTPQPSPAAQPGQPATASWGQPATPPGAPAAPPPGTTWGGTPVQPPKPQGPRSTSGRTAALVLGVIVAVVAGVNVVNAALPLPEDPVLVDPGPGIPIEPLPTEEPLPVESPEPGEPGEPGETEEPEETITPIRTLPPLEPGPVEAGDPIDVGAGYQVTPPAGWTIVGGEDGLTVLQKGGALVIVGGFPWPGTPTDLAQLYAEGWFSGGQFTSDEPQTGVIANGIPAAVISYAGVASGSAIDGAIFAAAVDGSGLIVNVFGAQGSLDGVSADIDLMLSTVTHTGG